MVISDNNQCRTQVHLKQLTRKFSEKAKRCAIKKSSLKSKSFLIERKHRFDIDGGLSLDEPFLTNEELAKLKDESFSRFTREANRKVALNRVFSNAINYSLFDLSQSGEVDLEKLKEHNDIVFDEKTLSFMDFLYRRYEASQRPGTPSKSITLSEAIPHFSQSSTDGTKHTKAKVRDVIVIALAELGLICGNYSIGSGYALYAGPVLINTVENAVEPWLESQKL